jgi:hypothetical protein
MMQELNMDVSPVGVARYLAEVVTTWVIDEADAVYASVLRELGWKVLVTVTIMRDAADKIHLANKILPFLSKIDK